MEVADAKTLTRGCLSVTTRWSGSRSRPALENGPKVDGRRKWETEMERKLWLLS
jgi:hypothetical protein